MMQKIISADKSIARKQGRDGFQFSGKFQEFCECVLIVSRMGPDFGGRSAAEVAHRCHLLMVWNSKSA